MYVLVLRPYRKDNIYFRTIEEREKIKSILYTCTLIDNPMLFILCSVSCPKHEHKLTLYDWYTCIWYMPEWLCLFQQFVFVYDKCSNLMQFEKQIMRNVI